MRRAGGGGGEGAGTDGAGGQVGGEAWGGRGRAVSVYVCARGKGSGKRRKIPDKATRRIYARRTRWEMRSVVAARAEGTAGGRAHSNGERPPGGAGGWGNRWGREGEKRT